MLTIDKATGAATVVGSYGDFGGQIPDISFDAYGYLYGWNENEDSLARIDPATGATTHIGTYCGGCTYATGPVSSTNAMYVKTGDDITPISPQTGNATGGTVSVGDTNNPLDFSPSDVLYTVMRPEWWGTTGTGSTLQTLNPSTGALTDIGNDPDVHIHALAFDTGVWTPLSPSADLRLEASFSSPSRSVGGMVTLTLSVENLGPNDANATVTNVLPAGLTYVSDDGGGAYNSGTGEWTAGAITAASTATLNIVVTVNSAGQLTDTATVASNVYNPGPVAASASVTGVLPMVTGLTASVSQGSVTVSWSGTIASPTAFRCKIGAKAAYVSCTNGSQFKAKGAKTVWVQAFNSTSGWGPEVQATVVRA